ncbi:pilus assembly PilX family protein [Pelagibaculum spongiae]|uniref:PilX/PilW C-terminal domain-containing protein n=1 Tax=Pelagibaculum spongiae TaxID=2080658 RepID=A0A2V1H5U2_9GAMM|nr:pilus assembly protein [Pelagibaculum spongiae]PVZ71792.1 hypothetical protein DC094_01835 [Pelagibaculum spongiae]
MMKKQRGIVLLVSLVLLIVMSLIVLPTLEQGVIDQKLVVVNSDHQLADVGSEAALTGGEEALQNLTDAPAADHKADDIVTPARVDSSGELEDLPATWAWWLNPEDDGLQKTFQFGLKITGEDGNAVTDADGNNQIKFGDLTAPPRYVIEYVGYDLQDSTGRVEVVDPAQRMRRIGPSYYRVTSASVGRDQESLSRFQSLYIKRQ